MFLPNTNYEFFSKNRHLAYKTERQAREGLKGLVAHNLERLGFIG
jgi:hypothetical protein